VIRVSSGRVLLTVILTPLVFLSDASRLVSETSLSDCDEKSSREVAALVVGADQRETDAAVGALRHMINTYVKDFCDCDDITNMLRSMRHLVALTKAPSAASEVRAYESPYPTNRRDVLLVWINPTCPHCRNVADLIHDYQHASSDAPAAVFRMLPSTHDEVSQYTALNLQVLEFREPAQFVPRLYELLHTPPSDIQSVDARMKDLFAYPALELPESDGARKCLLQASQSFPSEMGAPVVVFRGRILSPNKEGGLLFDPLRNVTNLEATVHAIRVADGRRSQ